MREMCCFKFVLDIMKKADPATTAEARPPKFPRKEKKLTIVYFVHARPKAQTGWNEDVLVQSLGLPEEERIAEVDLVSFNAEVASESDIF